MRNKPLFLLFTASLLSVVSCSDELEPLQKGNRIVDIESVSMIAHDFQYDDYVGTKTQIGFNSEGVTFKWTGNDIVGVFPNNGHGTQVKFPVKEGEVDDGEETSEANFTGNGWAVMAAETYSSYYPFVPDMNLDMTNIPVNYMGQIQNGIGTTEHLTKFDYMATCPTVPESNGNIAFDFQHLGTVLQLEMKVPKVAEYNSLLLTCDGKPFITSGSIDITSGTPVINAESWSNDFEIKLENFATTTANQTVVINLLIAPVDLSGEKIKVKLSGPHATFVTHFERSKPYKAGTASHPALGTLEGGDVIMLEDGESFNIAIKSLANGEEFRLEKREYRIEHIVFEANNSDIPSDPYVDVSSADSKLPIYASWNAASKTITVTSPSPAVFLNENSSKLFYNLVDLKDIDLSQVDASYTLDLSNMFESCELLEEIDLSTINPDHLVSMSHPFAGCGELVSLTLPSDGFPASLTGIEGFFSGCRKLPSIDLSAFSECTFGTMREIFQFCSSLTEIDLSKLNISEDCADFISTFESCDKIATIDLSGLNLRNVINCSYMFMYCSSLEEVKLGDAYMPNCGYADEMFAFCENLSSIDFVRFEMPNSQSTGAMFFNCSSLTGIDVSKLVSSSTTCITQMFAGCSSLTSIDVSEWNTSGITDFGELFCGCSTLETVDISNFTTYDNTSCRWMFKDCGLLEDITFGENFDTRNVVSFDGMFEGCKSLETIDISNFSTKNAKDFKNMFAGCSGLKQLAFPSSFTTEESENMGEMFDGCSSLQALDLSNFHTSKVIDFGCMLRGCSNLASIVWGSNFDTHYAESMGEMFAGCASLASLDLSFFDTQSVTNTDRMFQDCTSLSELHLDLFNLEHATLTRMMFCGMANDCTIYCSEDFVNQLSNATDPETFDGFDPYNATWINAETEQEITFPNI